MEHVESFFSYSKTTEVDLKKLLKKPCTINYL